MPPSPNKPHLNFRPGEQGYVLITAIWLLILAGSIVAVVTLRTLSQAREIKEQGEALSERIALESAVETVFADRLFAGNHSQWWLTPTSGQVNIEGISVETILTSESGRLDINEADPKLIKQALRGLGIDEKLASEFADEVRQRRSEENRINTFSEVRSMLPQSSAGCLEENLTLTSGLATPRPDQMPDALARAMGQATSVTPASPEAGAALRLRASRPGQAGLLVVARVTGLREAPLSISSWDYPSACE